MIKKIQFINSVIPLLEEDKSDSYIHNTSTIDNPEKVEEEKVRVS